MNVFEYVKSLDIKEFDQFMYAIYIAGNNDGRKLFCDETRVMFKASNFDAEKFTKTLQDYTQVSVHDTFEKWLPTADVKEEKLGTWEDTTAYCGEFTCSVCKEMCVTNKYKWCPHCGAKMDREEEV